MRNLQCEIQQWNTQCHAATDTVAMLTHKLIFQFVGKINIYHLIINYFQVSHISQYWFSFFFIPASKKCVIYDKLICIYVLKLKTIDPFTLGMSALQKSMFLTQVD